MGGGDPGDLASPIHKPTGLYPAAVAQTQLGPHPCGTQQVSCMDRETEEKWGAWTIT